MEKVFDKPFEEVMDTMAEGINPRASSKTLERESLIGRIMDFGILLRKGYGQAWQFIAIIQALFIFLGLSEKVSDALYQVLGIQISGYWIGVVAIAGVVFFVIFGLAMLLIGGSQRSQFLVKQKQNPAQFMDKKYYEISMRKLREIDKRLDRLEEKVGE